jgi:hypothetical protein
MGLAVTASEAELRELEEKHRIKLPASYRAFMQSVGAGAPTPHYYFDEKRAVHAYLRNIFPISDEYMFDQVFPFPRPRQSGYLTVGGNGGGDYFLLRLTNGHVYYWDHEEAAATLRLDDLTWLASSIGSLFGNLIEDPESGDRLNNEPNLSHIQQIGRYGTTSDAAELVRNGKLYDMSPDGRTLAEEAAHYGNLDVLRHCLASGAPLEKLIHHSVRGGNVELIRFLVESGADVNAMNDAGFTPLDLAILPRIYQVLEELGGKHRKTGKPPHLR